MAAMIKVGNVMRKETADPLAKLLEGRTYMNFHVCLCPVGGSFDVCVETIDPDIGEEELHGMVTEFLAANVMGIGGN